MFFSAWSLGKPNAGFVLNFRVKYIKSNIGSSCVNAKYQLSNFNIVGAIKERG